MRTIPLFAVALRHANSNHTIHLKRPFTSVPTLAQLVTVLDEAQGELTDQVDDVQQEQYETARVEGDVLGALLTALSNPTSFAANREVDNLDNFISMLDHSAEIPREIGDEPVYLNIKVAGVEIGAIKVQRHEAVVN